MGGKKKKNVANKLAKMSDEERARYMQQRLEMEEEAKRRKEQLIATFMKKKVKKEQAFSRLNLAKINQNWHQILRKAKCKEMRDNVEHLKEWLDRIMTYKNRTIAQLLKDLEDAEEDYLNNFTTHTNHLKHILKEQSEYVHKLNEQYLKDLSGLLGSAEKEREEIFKQAEEEEIYLKTILHRQEVNDIVVKKEVKNNMQKYYEAENDFQSQLQKMLKWRDETCGVIWKETEEHISQYIEKTDARRLHFAELKRLDLTSASEIAQNEERIKHEEAEICTLKEKLEHLQSVQELHVSSLNQESAELKQHFFKIRKNLQRDLEIDDKKSKLLAEVSAETIEYLENVAQKGEYIKNMASSCRKYETDREKLMKWFAVTDKLKSIDKANQEEEPQKTDINEIPNLQKIIARESTEEDLKTEESKLLEVQAEQPSQFSPHRTIGETPSPETNNIASVQKITFFDKLLQESPSPSTSEESEEMKPLNFVDGCLKSLEPLENFWASFNKVEVDFMELKDERKELEKENKQLRGMIRAVLEAAALANSIPTSKVSTRIPSRRLSACSTVLPRIIIQ